MINLIELQRQSRAVQIKELIKDTEETLKLGLEFILITANKGRKLSEASSELTQFRNNTKGYKNV